jgi:hypothetical protein
VPEKIISTLTSSILKSVHTSISLIFSYKLCSVATPGHPEPLLLENHVRIVAFTPDLQRVSSYSITDFLYHSSTTELLLSLIFIKGSYPSSEASHLCRKSSSVFVVAEARKFMHDRHADLYLGSKRDDFGWCETTL